MILFNLVRTFVAVEMTGEESHCFSLKQGIGCVSMISGQTLFIIILIEFHCFISTVLPNTLNCFLAKGYMRGLNRSHVIMVGLKAQLAARPN